MTKAVLIRHQLHISIFAVPVQLNDVLAGQRVFGLPNLREGWIRKGKPFDVELKLIQLDARHEIDEIEQRLELWYLVSADIQHCGPNLEIRMVTDLETRYALSTLTNDLAKGAHSVERSAGLGVFDLDLRAIDGQEIGIVGK